MDKGEQRDSGKGPLKPVISIKPSSITEGESLTTLLTNLKPRKKFFYSLTGDGIDKKDLEWGKIQGSFKSSKQGKAVISHIFANDKLNEGTETFTLSIFKDKKNKTLLGKSQTIRLIDSGNLNNKPTFSLQSKSIKEGKSFKTRLSNLRPGNKYFFRLNGNGITKNDLDSGKLQGSFKTSKQGKAVIRHNFANDKLNEGTETFTLSIFKDKKNKTLLGKSQTIRLIDSGNLNNKPTFSLQSKSIKEGKSFKTRLSNLRPGNKYFFRLNGNGITKNDLDSGKLQGSFKTSKQGKAIIRHTFANDNLSEGTETFTLSIFKDKKNRKLLGKSQVVSIEDLSKSYTNGGDKESTTKIDGVIVNGFYLDKVISDKVYEKNSSLIQRNANILGRELIKNAITFNLEIEFGEEFIALTTNSIRKDSTTQSSRTVFQGDFKYGDDKITSARIDYIGQASQGEGYEWGVINKHGMTVPRPDSASSWQSTLMNMGETVYEYDINNDTQGKIEGDYWSVTSFGMGRFFYEGWENNPFASDLI